MASINYLINQHLYCFLRILLKLSFKSAAVNFTEIQRSDIGCPAANAALQKPDAGFQTASPLLPVSLFFLQFIPENYDQKS
jgi:hypothetical protein